MKTYCWRERLISQPQSLTFMTQRKCLSICEKLTSATTKFWSASISDGGSATIPNGWKSGSIFTTKCPRRRDEPQSGSEESRVGKERDRQWKHMGRREI